MGSRKKIGGQRAVWPSHLDKSGALHFDPRQKAKRREEVFPRDCEKAFAPGVRLIKGLV